MLIHFKDYQVKAMETCNPELSKKDMLINGILGLNGELAEALVHSIKFNNYKLYKNSLIHEFGDVYWYVALITTALDIDPEFLISDLTIEQYEHAVYCHMSSGENPEKIFGNDVYNNESLFKMNTPMRCIYYAGKVTDIVKKILFQGHQLTNEVLSDIKNSLTNLVFYLTIWHTKYEITLFSILNFNLYKLSQRYPNGFDSEHSINRKEEL